MCLIVFAWKLVPGTPLIAVANRDEFYDRPAAAADHWNDYPQVIAGRDLRANGTWLGVSESGRFAALTNIRALTELREGSPNMPSRGTLAADFLTGNETAQDYVRRVREKQNQFKGFNLLVGDSQDLIWYSNRFAENAQNGLPLAPGIYGLSNAQLDTPWPKVVRTKAQFASMLCQGAAEEAYFEMLSDTMLASDCHLPKTGVDLALERALSAVCIAYPGYGTRASTVVRMHADGSVSLHERPIHHASHQNTHQSTHQTIPANGARCSR